MLSIVVAIANNNVIGGNNTLLWRLPADMKRFKELTTTSSKTLIMGRKTFESLPKILPERKHIVITRNANFSINDKNVSVIHNMGELEPLISSELEYFVIGGGEIYNLLLPHCSKMYITRIHESFIGDTYFPEFNELNWELISEVHGLLDEKNKLTHSFLTFIKK